MSQRGLVAVSFVLCLLRAVVAQTEHVITVGKAAHKFSPDVVYAAIGDTITWEFYPKNHSVVRGDFMNPCVPYEKVNPLVDGIFSGFKPVKEFEKNPPRFSITINNTDPIFFYCSAPGSCNQWGMTGVINPTDTTPIEDYQTRAKKADFVLQPGEDWPAEGGGDSTKSSAAAESQVTVTASPSSSPTSTPASTSNDDDDKLSVGGIAGVAIGSAAVVALIGALFFFLGRRRGEQAPPPPPTKEHPVSSIYHSGAPQIPPGSVPPSMRGSFAMHPAYAAAYAPDGTPIRSPGPMTPDIMDKPYGWRASHQTVGDRPVEMGNDPNPYSEMEPQNPGWNGVEDGARLDRPMSDEYQPPSHDGSRM